MATKSTPRPPVKPSLTTVKQERREAVTTNQQPPPPFTDSVSQLRSLSAAISAFHRRYDELQGHLDFIRTTIDSKLPHQNTTTSSLAPVPSPPLQLKVTIQTPTLNTAISPIPKSSNSELQQPSNDKPPPNNIPESANSEQQKPNDDKPPAPPLPESTDSEQKPSTELEQVCERMSSRDLRKYLTTNLSNIEKIREEAPKALKFAPNPAKLVLETLGRFYLQGKKAYTKGSPMIVAREVSIAVLEVFLLTGCNGVEIEKPVREEANVAAMAWRKRLISEDKLAKVCEADARGLLLLVGCFGVPAAFKSEDVRDLVRACDAGRISAVVRRSGVLVAMISEIIEKMLKNKMEIEALDIVYTLGIVDRFPPQTILESFLRESKETWRKTRKATQGSFSVVNEANKKQLADLKSVVKCLENHKIDPSKLLPGWQLKDKILSLEKDIADFEKKNADKVMAKRKADKAESSRKSNTQEMKRARLKTMDPYNARLPGHINNFSASPSILRGSAAGSYPETITGPVAGSSGGFPGGILPTGSYAGIHRGMLDMVNSQQYTGVRGGMLDTAGQISHNSQLYGWREDAALNERLVGHNFAGQPSSVGYDDLYGPLTSSPLKGFVGLPNSAGLSGRASTSDLYQFADSVLESESYRSSGHEVEEKDGSAILQFAKTEPRFKDKEKSNK
ncbi:hypothetical protein RJ639_037867 [Escallonia herrerae]|uniref:FRIGIDA-like protein n=1 Tax=Escallonia herrerae TaxID=1293975 RepID=A0AA88WMY5_9ASTE|nr:hypothetical protein RJ639_037867 [Escallonia herrerae]